MGDKVRENRARRRAHRRGLELHKVRRRDPLARDFELWEILDEHGRPLQLEAPSHKLTLEEAERLLSLPWDELNAYLRGGSK